MDLSELSAADLAARIASGQASPGEALDAYRSRIASSDPAINAFVTLDWDAAESRAESLDATAPTGALHGVPVGIKDIFLTNGLRTTYGSRSFADHVPTEDALHVSRLRAAGAVIIGKTNTPEFGFSGQTTNDVAGTTRNPLDTTRTVAGSSGGAAAALAAHMVALADGSDFGGSVRSPAAWCGLVGFRPTPGLIPLVPNPSPFDGLHVPGPMGRSVTDVALMTQVMAGNDVTAPLGFWGDPIEAHASAIPARRVAFSTAPFGVTVDSSIAEALGVVPQVLSEMGCELAEGTPNLSPLIPYVGLVRGLCALQIRASLKPDMNMVGESFSRACAVGEGRSLEELAEFHGVRSQVWIDTAAFFSHHDFAIWPTTSGLAYSADVKESEIPEDWRTVTLTPMLGLPSVSIPCGIGSDGLPVGLQITGPRGSDWPLLAFAAQLEAAIAGDSH